MKANPGNLGNTDGFDTINSNNITIQVRIRDPYHHLTRLKLTTSIE